MSRGLQGVSLRSQHTPRHPSRSRVTCGALGANPRRKIIRTATVVLALFVLTGSALAGGNPGVTAYIDFDPPNSVHWVQPEPGATIHAYVCFSDLEMGLTSVCFRLNDVMSEFSGVFSSCSFVNLLPGGLSLGDPFTGIVLASSECESDAVVVVGELQLEYLGGDACIELLEHPDYPRSVFDCNAPSAEVDYYIHTANGTVGGESYWCPPSDVDIDVRCEPQAPGSPMHPPTYWYDCHPSYYQLAPYFAVRVFDSDTTNYTNWVQPEGFVHSFEYEGDELWVTWRDTAWYPGPARSALRFQFDNPNSAGWGGWRFGGMTSEDFTWKPDGYGFRVHVPEGSTGLEEISTWGTIKSLYR